MNIGEWNRVLEYVLVHKKNVLLVGPTKDLPLGLLYELVRVNKDNVYDVAENIRRGGCLLSDPENRLDSALKDKLICIPTDFKFAN